MAELIGRITLVAFGFLCWGCFVHLLASYTNKREVNSRSDAWVCFGVSLIVFGIAATIFTITQ